MYLHYVAMTLKILNEEQLVNELRLGNREAFGEIYAHYRDGLFNYCNSLVKDNSRADDLVHETFLKVWSTIQTLKHTSSFRSWIFSIARNQALLFLRDRKPFEKLSDEIPLTDDDALDLMISSEASAALGNLLDQLRPAYRELIALRVYEELSYVEIASVTGISVSAIRVHLYRARKALAGIYTRRYGENYDE